jgi:hypothetical protein
VRKLSFVIAGFDPAIHLLERVFSMDARVNPRSRLERPLART